MKIDDTVEHRDDVSSAKKTLMKVKKNDRKIFVGNEPGLGKNTNTTLIVMHKIMVMEGKDWIRNNYGNKFLCVNNIEHKSSVMLCKQQIPDKAKDVDFF